MFGRATIRLGIGPHSSCIFFSAAVVASPFTRWQLTRMKIVKPFVRCRHSTKCIAHCTAQLYFLFDDVCRVFLTVAVANDAKYNSLVSFITRMITASPHSKLVVFMVALCNRETIYIFILSSCSFFLLLLPSSSSFFSSPNLSGRRLDVYHTSTHGVALVRI